MAIVWPFDMYLWIAIIVAVPASATIYWIFAMLQYKDEKESISFGTSLSQILQILVYQGNLYLLWQSSLTDWQTNWFTTNKWRDKGKDRGKKGGKDSVGDEGKESKGNCFRPVRFGL